METLALEKLVEELRRAARREPLRWRGFLAEAVRTRMRKRLRSGEEKVYEGYRITIPLDIARELKLDENPELAVLIAPAKWYHGMNYSHPAVRERIWSSLPDYAKAEICMLGSAPDELCRGYRTVIVVASEEELQRLSLEPGQTITLKELLKKARASAQL